MTFYGSKKSEIVDFVDLPSTFLVCNASICPIYMLMKHIWSPHKCILRQSMCTHAAQKKFHKFCIFSDGSEISAHMCLLGAHHKISFLEKTRQVYIFRIVNYYLFGYFIKQVIYLKPNIKQKCEKKSKFCWFFGKIDEKKVSFFTKMNVRNGHLIASLSYL